MKALVLDYLFPPICSGCKREDIWLCSDCRKLVPPHYLELSPKEPFTRVIAAASYTCLPIREAIHELKYNSVIGYAGMLAEVITKQLPASFFDKGLLVPVPLHPLRLKKRGFNQSYKIAQELATHHSIVTQELLTRKRLTKPQVEQEDRQSRLANVKDSFGLIETINLSIQNKHIILIDDVLTTGATMFEAGKILKNLKPLSLKALAVALDD